jgi:hypothetical protein
MNKVYPRWLNIHTYLELLAKPGSNPWAQEVEAYLRRGASGWNERVQKQV